MRFRLSTILLLMAVIALAVGWVVDRSRRAQHEVGYLASMTTPAELATIEQGDPILVRANFLDGDMKGKRVGDEPTVWVEMLAPMGDSFVLVLSKSINVKAVPEHPDRYQIEAAISETSHLFEGEYLIRLHCEVNGVDVVSPTKLIRIKAKQPPVNKP